MATKLVNCSSMMMFKPGLRSVVRNCRAFSSAPRTLDSQLQDPTDESTKTQTVWPDHLLGPLGPQDKRFPMPGRVGPCASILQLNQMVDVSQVTPAVFDLDNVLPKLPSQRHMDIAEQFLTSLDELDLDFIDRGVSFPVTSDVIECRVNKCPQLLRKEFKEIFPDRNIMEGDLTVVTIYVTTKNGSKPESSNVEPEYDELHEMFIQSAVGICQALEDDGYWADFIDPSSGKPFKGPHTDRSLYETDDCYRKLGFQIRDLICCKIITHPVLGSHAYVCSLFTSAPLNTPLLMNLVITDRS